MMRLTDQEMAAIEKMVLYPQIPKKKKNVSWGRMGVGQSEGVGDTLSRAFLVVSVRGNKETG